MATLLDIITSDDPSTRDQSLDAWCAGRDLPALLAACETLETFRRGSDNLYHRVRALFFLHAIHRFHLPPLLPAGRQALVAYDGHVHLLQRRYEEAIDVFREAAQAHGLSDGLASALAESYHSLAFQTLADQVRRSVRSVRGNQWMFRTGHPHDQPLRIRPELTRRADDGQGYPLLVERTPVRMDLSHSGWSDIFFLGMDFPEGARVLNISIDLAVCGRDAAPQPPIASYLRVIDEPVMRLVSVDLGVRAEISSLADVFDFARDYSGLLKAAVIAAGLVPPGLEGSEESLGDLLERLVGPGLGLEIVSHVNDIPKGSRLAVSTNLLASIISLCMRATSQARSLTGELSESERRIVAARAILGEWIGGSGGGWQDSGGVWPGMKLIQGAPAQEGDPEHGVSRGRLLPDHRILDESDASAATRQALQDSLVLVHGGMAQNVGPILEMVTEKYLLRGEAEWAARQHAAQVLDRILAALRDGDIRALGAATTENFNGPLQAIIPWANNHYTQAIIDAARGEFGDDFWGFWMLGGMSGGGMGFIVDPARKAEAQDFLLATMRRLKAQLAHALPFAMDPVVYDFAINAHGTYASLQHGATALLPAAYYALILPQWLRTPPKSLPIWVRHELERVGAASRTEPAMAGLTERLLEDMLPHTNGNGDDRTELRDVLAANGFDTQQHEQIRSDLRAGRIGLAQNRLPNRSVIEDVQDSDITDARAGLPASCQAAGEKLLADGAVAVLSLAAGVGSRWTQGAGVVKALNPFARLGDRHRSFLEVHLAKSRRRGAAAGTPVPHLFTTSYLTHQPIADFLAAHDQFGYPGPVLLSPGKAIGLRMVPMVRDLRFAWEEMPQQLLDEQQQKMKESVHAALIGWAESQGEGSDYTDNLPLQCLHPVGHWYEVPNLLRNGVLADLLRQRPHLQYIMLHNIDTLGADIDPAILGWHAQAGHTLSYEVIPRRIEDLGGGLGRVDGRVRLIEGLAMPRERDEFKLRYYNTLTTWIDVHKLLALFDLSVADLDDPARVADAVRRLAARMSTYVTLKDVKKRWGHGQEDVMPVAQFEKLWGDMTALADVDCGFIVVPRLRGQQLKDPAQLDGWLRDGSAAHVASLCQWD